MQFPKKRSDVLLLYISRFIYKNFLYKPDLKETNRKQNSFSICIELYLNSRGKAISDCML